MTSEQKDLVKSFRADGMGYKSIAHKLDIPESTVKSFCRRMERQPEKKEQADTTVHRCLYCGVVVEQTPGRKEKKFCSDKCRNKWWNSHLDQVNRKAVHDVKCKYCGKVFQVYGKSPKKYCCHDCYIKDRFNGGHHYE